MRAFLALLLRDLRLALRHGADTLLVVGFFFIAAILFPFAVGPDPALLGRIAAGIVWVMALLATLGLSLERLFLADFEDGSLDLIAVAPLPLELAVLAKAAAHWLASGVPLILATPVIAVLLGLEGQALPPLIAAMALGTPLLSLIGAWGAALSLGARRGGVLLVAPGPAALCAGAHLRGGDGGCRAGRAADAGAVAGAGGVAGGGAAAGPARRRRSDPAGGGVIDIGASRWMRRVPAPQSRFD